MSISGSLLVSVEAYYRKKGRLAKKIAVYIKEIKQYWA